MARVDLTQLSVSREPPPVRRAIWTRYVLPGLLLAGFAGLALYAARDSFSPPRSVTVIPVASAQGDGAGSDAALFRAAGWVEPRPTPTVVTALAEGVVERLLAVEGQAVKQGEVVARLIGDDARLTLESADAEVELRAGEVDAAKAAEAAAQARLEVPVHLQAELADAESALAKAESEQATLPDALAAAEARSDAARREYESSRKAAVAPVSLAKARGDMEALLGGVRELQARQKRLPIEAAALRAKRDAQKAKLDRKIDEVRQLAEAKAAVKSADARRRMAAAARDAAKLRLDRMEVKAPAAGRVLSLVARPGTRLNGLTASSQQDSSTVLTLYDPASLQARVDVRLDDVAKVRPGQRVRLESAAVPGVALEGEVLLATSQADIQKNTLSVKVAILAPPPALRPDMLCQVTFLAPPRSGKPASGPERLLVPRQLLDGNALWVVDQAGGTARRRAVEVGAALGDLVEVVSGLASSDKLIVGGRDGLRDGERVRVAGEDGTLGIGGR